MAFSVPGPATLLMKPAFQTLSRPWVLAKHANESWPPGPALQAPREIILESSVKVRAEDGRSLCLFPSACPGCQNISGV